MELALMLVELVREVMFFSLLMLIVFFIGAAWGSKSAGDFLQEDIEQTGHFIHRGKLYRAEEVGKE